MVVAARRTISKIAIQAGMIALRRQLYVKCHASMTTFFLLQSQRVNARVLNWQKALPSPGDLLPPEEDALLRATLMPLVTQGVFSGAELAALSVGGQPPQLWDKSVASALADAAPDVVGINDATRNAIQRSLTIANERGYNLFQIAHGVPNDGFGGLDTLVQQTYRNRSDAIARTEMGRASLYGAQAGWKENGVQYMEIEDGNEDYPCASRDGTVVPIEKRVDLNHPNCTVVTYPVISSPRFKPRVQAVSGPRDWASIQTQEDLRQFAKLPMNDSQNDYFVHGTRYRSDLERIAKDGIRLGNNGTVSATPTAFAEARAEQIGVPGHVDWADGGYVVFRAPPGEAVLSMDLGREERLIQQAIFNHPIPPEDIVRVVRQIPYGTGGFSISETNLATFALNHQEFAGLSADVIRDIAALPVQYQRWFHLSLSPITNAAAWGAAAPAWTPLTRRVPTAADISRYVHYQYPDLIWNVGSTPAPTQREIVNAFEGFKRRYPQVEVRMISLYDARDPSNWAAWQNRDKTLLINRTFFAEKTPQEVRAVLQRHVEIGWSPRNTGTTRATIEHELSHALMYTDQQIIDMADDLFRYGQPRRPLGRMGSYWPSQYSHKNPHEAFAEAVTEMLHAPASKWSGYTQQLAQRFKQLGLWTPKTLLPSKLPVTPQTLYNVVGARIEQVAAGNFPGYTVAPQSHASGEHVMASTTARGRITLYPRFFEASSVEQQIILQHEMGHWVDTELKKRLFLRERLLKPFLLPNGRYSISWGTGTTAHEVIADTYTALQDFEPERFQGGRDAHYLNLMQEVARTALDMGLPVPPKWLLWVRQLTLL